MTIFTNDIGQQIWEKKYRYKDETYEQWIKRISNYNPKLQKLIEEKKFLFGGRILANLHTHRGSLSNCYSLGFIQDSLKEIMQANTDLALTYKAQGGQGLSLSKIRPKGTKVGDEFTSDGIEPFLIMYDTTTASIAQGAGRRGALLMSIDITHKEAPRFITIKSDRTKLNNTNISVEISNEFMEYIALYYETGVKETMHVTKAYEGQIIEYDIVPIDLYKLLIKQAYENAEPGVIFSDEFRNYNLMEYDTEYKIETCNPCGEQPLAKHAACLLGSINLSEYVINPFTKEAYFDFKNFSDDVELYYEELDNLVDIGLNFHALKEQERQAYKYRNIGLGTMGEADAYIKMGFTYGQHESIRLAEEIRIVLALTALQTNFKLGDKRGPFLSFQTIDVYKKSMYYQDVTNKDYCIPFYELKTGKKFQEGKFLRNCSMLTIAPSGSISTLLNISSGIEPNFAFSYKRKTLALDSKEIIHDIEASIVEDYRKATNNQGKLPEYFVTSADIHFKDRIILQGTVQHFIDAAISSTINLPKTTTLEEIEQLYLFAWTHYLKGLTIYVDGSRDGILYTEKSQTVGIKPPIKRAKTLPASLYNIQVDGKKYSILVGLNENNPYEVFGFPNISNLKERQIEGVTTKIKKGHFSFTSLDGEVVIDKIDLGYEDIEARAITLLVSMLLRHGADIKFIIKTAKKVNPIISSFTSAICRILMKYDTPDSSEACPKCGNKLVHEGACTHCSSCEYSKCFLLYTS